MKRVIVIYRKMKVHNPVEVFSNLKLLCESYPEFNYNTLNNYLSKNKIAFENDAVRIERKVVHTAPIPQRKMAVVGKKVVRNTHDEETLDKAYWMSRPPGERMEALQRLRSQLIPRNMRMDRSVQTKRKSG